jgi:GGDEF domain-containing protein
MLKKNGESIDVLISAKSLRDEEGNFLYSMAGVVDVTERKKAEEEVQRLAHYDILTGQPNRFLLEERLQHALGQAQRDENEVGVLFVDLDRFKWVNDTLGHACGDQLLKKVAGKLQRCVRQGDTVARIGGDEFVIGFR